MAGTLNIVMDWYTEHSNWYMWMLNMCWIYNWTRIYLLHHFEQWWVKPVNQFQNTNMSTLTILPMYSFMHGEMTEGSIWAGGGGYVWLYDRGFQYGRDDRNARDWSWRTWHGVLTFPSDGWIPLLILCRTILKIVITEFDKENFKIKARGYGEEFQIGKHPQGTEVKAITYSAMQIYDDEKHECFVIIDI